MTFLELAQQVARESGTIPGRSQPPTVTGLTGRLASVVDWTQEAWREIQRHRDTWRWMRREFEGPALAGGRYVDAIDLSLTRFGSWVYNFEPGTDSGVTLRVDAEGVASERALYYLPWDLFRARYLRGAQEPGRPVFFSVDPQDRFALAPVPDVDCILAGQYQRDVQPLVLGADVPEMPSRFHELIVWRALVLLGENDESVVQEPRWKLRAGVMMGELERAQLPRMGFNSTLA